MGLPLLSTASGSLIVSVTALSATTFSRSLPSLSSAFPTALDISFVTPSMAGAGASLFQV